MYYSLYDFELYSNFTFFLNDPVNGDQIRQKEDRQIFGIKTEWNQITNFDNSELLLQIGAGIRYDDINNNELSRTMNRKTTLSQIQFGDVDESNIFAYANVEYDFIPPIKMTPVLLPFQALISTLYTVQIVTSNFS